MTVVGLAGDLVGDRGGRPMRSGRNCGRAGAARRSGSAAAAAAAAAARPPRPDRTGRARWRGRPAAATARGRARTPPGTGRPRSRSRPAPATAAPTGSTSAPASARGRASPARLRRGAARVSGRRRDFRSSPTPATRICAIFDHITHLDRRHGAKGRQSQIKTTASGYSSPPSSQPGRQPIQRDQCLDLEARPHQRPFAFPHKHFRHQRRGCCRCRPGPRHRRRRS